jgi:hypothetical protein
MPRAPGLEHRQILDRLTATFDVPAAPLSAIWKSFLAELAHLGLATTET